MTCFELELNLELELHLTGRRRPKVLLQSPTVGPSSECCGSTWLYMDTFFPNATMEEHAEISKERTTSGARYACQ